MKKTGCWLATAAMLLTGCAAQTSVGEPSPTPSTAPTMATLSTITVDKTATVVDAFAGELELDGMIGSYRVPQVSVDGQPLTVLNDAMYEALYDGVLMHQVYAEEGRAQWSDMTYHVGESETLVSVLVVLTAWDDGHRTYMAYSADKQTGAVINDRATVAGCFDLTEEELDARIAGVLQMGYVNRYASSGVDAALYEEKLTMMLDAEMIARSTPFVGENGTLCAIADMAAFGDADYEKVVLDVTNGVL